MPFETKHWWTEHVLSVAKAYIKADDCTTVYQKQYVANPQAANMINLPQDPLNED